MIATFLGIDDPQLAAAVIAVVVAFVTTIATSPVRYAFDRLLERTKAKTEYEYEQRRELRSKIGGYHGRLLEAATSLNYRLDQIYNKRHESWLDVQGDYSQRWPHHYFFNSTIYRFMAFVALVNKFEREAIYIDSRIADSTDRLFLFYVKAMRWTLTDVALFDGFDYDGSEATDHFFTDHLRRMCESISSEGSSSLVDLSTLEDHLATEHELNAVLEFFGGLSPQQEERYRWDRLMAFQLVLMAFIETFGYEIQKSEPRWFDAVAKRMRPEIAINLLDWLPKLGIGVKGRLHRGLDPGGAAALSALKLQNLPEHMNRVRAQAQAVGGADPLT